MLEVRGDGEGAASPIVRARLILSTDHVIPIGVQEHCECGWGGAVCSRYSALLSLGTVEC